MIRIKSTDDIHINIEGPDANDLSVGVPGSPPDVGQCPEVVCSWEGGEVDIVITPPLTVSHVTNTAVQF